MGYDIPVYIDGMDDKVGQMYAARPSRLYFVGKNGIVIHIGQLGLDPEKLENEIKKYLDQ